MVELTPVSYNQSGMEVGGFQQLWTQILKKNDEWLVQDFPCFQRY